MAYKNLRETCFFKTGREGVVLEFLDEMYPNLFDFNTSIDNSILKRYSKFKVTLVDSRKTSGAGNAIYYNLSPDEMLLLSYLLSDGNAEHFKKRVGAYNDKSQTEQLFIKRMVETFDKFDLPRFDRLMDYDKAKEGLSITFQKNINTSADNLLIRKFTLSYEDAMRSASKWKITIEEGVGKKDVNKGNGLNIVKNGTYQSKAKSYLMLQVEEIVLPINEAASRVISAKQSFYPLMKAAEVDFTRRKIENKDYEGNNIDIWNPQGKVFSPIRREEPEIEAEIVEQTVANVAEIPKNEATTPTEEAKTTTETPKVDIKPGENKCSDCGADVTEKVKSFSTKQYKRALCFSCQKKAKASNQ